ncbi:Protein of unknown function (DUF3293) [Plasmodiophora brassicae]|uniref:Uncharacterized protein n=1 Tax=Plasmodiophora brassicae TaxID=37360 RepID=A0A0G4ILQ9_PLABS|nr:hypothetical protein PBRA_004769 [Plasmodiophora brassicae]SPQ93375.1 unnamed protein product [Plasmodiophora brassicae]
MVAERLAPKMNSFQALWAGAITCWRIPQGPAVFWAPATPATLAVKASAVPDVFQSVKAVFEITGWNPLGVVSDSVSNDERNRKLEAAIRSNDNVVWWCPSSGFDLRSWEEHGFAVAFGDTDLGRSWIVEQARDVQQGGIYEYQVVIGDDQARRVIRKTVPVVFDNVDADVEVVSVPDPRRAP